MKHYLSDGYVKIDLRVNKIMTKNRVHRLVMTAFSGPIPENHEVHHKNHIHDDNHVENLESSGSIRRCRRPL